MSKHTVTSDNKKLVIVRYSMSNDIRVCGHYLLFRRKFCTLFELEIADRARKCQIAIDTSEINEASSSAYTRLFTCELGKRQQGKVGGFVLTFILRFVVI